MKINNSEDNKIIKCTNCQGTGKQVFHRPFESVMGTCNFCKGTGKRDNRIILRGGIR